MISQNKPGKFPMIDIQIFVLLDNINGRFAAIPDSPKHKWVLWENLLQCLDALDAYVYPKIISGPDDWKERYWWMKQAFEHAYELIHLNTALLRRMCVSRLTFYNMVLSSMGYTDPFDEVINERSTLNEVDDEESVTIYGE
jgi:hypothetical protein